MTAPRSLLLTLFALSACSAQWKAGETGVIGGDTDTGETADSADSSSDSAEETGEPRPTIYNWVFATMPLSGRTAGFDFDGDGSPDNALSDFSTEIDVAIAAEMAAAGPVAVLQLAGIDPAVDPSDWDDDSVAVALLAATDGDGDPADNTSGAELFTTGGALDDAGEALNGQATAMVSGGYTAAFATTQLRHGALNIDILTPLRLAAYASPDTNGGTLGFGMSLTEAQALATAGGAPSSAVESMIRAADLDLDDDGERESISAAFQLTAVACQLE